MALKKATLKQRISARVTRSRCDVFLTRDFAALGGEDQIIPALRGLVVERKLVRLGKGIYAKARPSSLTGKAVLANRSRSPRRSPSRTRNRRRG